MISRSVESVPRFIDTAFQLLKGSTKQSTLWGYDPKIVNDLLAEKNSNIFIAAKPGKDAMPVNEQNRRSDTMLQELTELKEKHGDFDITSATGRAGWEAEPSFMLTNVPDTARDAINEIAARYKQDSIGVSERGEQGVNYVTPEGKTVEDGKFSGMEIQENPEYSTDFPSGQRLTFTYGEPMNIALQLLKAGNVGSVRGMGSGATDNVYHYPHELDYNSMSNYMGANPNATLGDMVSPYLQGQFTNNTSTNPPSYQSQAQTQFQNTVAAPFPQTTEQTQGVQQLINEGFDDFESRDKTRKPHYDSMNNAVRVLSRNFRANPAFNFAPPGRLRGIKGRNKSSGRTREMQNMKLRSLLDTPVSLATATMTPEQGIPIAASEPMNIAFQLLKERKSPEAMRRKKEYDTKYESSPERVKYREELNRERKRRGIYGSHNHQDVSHSQGGKLTLEGEHANRARHFKNRGTLRRVRVR